MRVRLDQAGGGNPRGIFHVLEHRGAGPRATIGNLTMDGERLAGAPITWRVTMTPTVARARSRGDDLLVADAPRQRQGGGIVYRSSTGSSR